jgi:hypothetical protein
LQFQRGFFIVPAACCFVNERAMGLDECDAAPRKAVAAAVAFGALPSIP